MLTLKKITTLLLICSLIVSCTKESADKNEQEELNAGCSGNEYYPYCPGPQYTYENRLFDEFALVTIPIYNQKYDPAIDTIINGVGFDKVLSRFLSGISTPTDSAYSTSFYFSTNNSIVQKFYAYETVNNITQKFLITGMSVKTNAPISGTWSTIDTFPSGKKATYDYTMKEKNISHTVYDTVYNNVIHVGYVHKVDGEIDYSGDYYLAKNIGLVEDAWRNGPPGINEAHWRLKKYIP